MKKRYDLEKIPNNQLLKDRVYHAIKDKILNLGFMPGEQLVEQSLSEELGVSKSPVREAFHRLETEGLIFSLAYRGAFVAPISEKEACDLFQLREALELYSIDQGLDGYTDEVIKEFESIMDEAVKDMTTGDEYCAYISHLAFHRLIIDKLDNILIADIYSNIQERLKRYLHVVVTYNPNRIKESNKQHKDIMKAIQQKNKTLVMEQLKQHLSTVLHDFLVLKGNPAISSLEIIWL
ncbi:MAG: GntR family transcriptional regulator [Deltaproteobacteria bacterium]|nr:GntR family transcriptional regulator [Deltaproteobacteria bacterium]